MFNRSILGAGMLLAAFAPGLAIAHSTGFVAPPGSHVVTVVAREYAFTMPASIPAGLTTFVLKDEGRQEHHMEVMKLDEGKTLADVMAAFAHPGPPPTWMHPIGGPNTPGPGGVSNATLVLQPGHYVAFCVIPAPDGKPHVMHGMITPFTVTPSKDAPAPLPKADMTITLRDYAFKLSRPLTEGHHVIKVINAGHQPHEMTMIRYPSNLGNRDLEAWVEQPNGPMPGHGAGGITDILPGTSVVIQVDIKAGKYGLICFTPGPDGKPHFMDGMQREFVVR
ncbi:MAG TPA: hypothetical protein VFM97_05340 [Gammaproteobacteria bacterium]|nr:hypothetical protein [Gammaproteobacteria bacterium]